MAGSEISQDQVKHELDVLLKQPQFAQQVRGRPGLIRKREFTRQLLALLIEQNVIARYAKAQRITVTPTELETTLSSVIQQQGGKKQFDAALVQSGADARRGQGEHPALTRGGQGEAGRRPGRVRPERHAATAGPGL